jgi:protein-S-isoprenylcysteine O-methyltransferase Ste14
MIIKIFILIAFVLIIFSLAVALLNLVTHKDPPEKTAKALTFRISLSLLLFFLLFIAVMTGLIKPHGLGHSIQQQKIQSSTNK